MDFTYCAEAVLPLLPLQPEEHGRPKLSAPPPKELPEEAELRGLDVEARRVYIGAFEHIWHAAVALERFDQETRFRHNSFHALPALPWEAGTVLPEEAALEGLEAGSITMNCPAREATAARAAREALSKKACSENTESRGEGSPQPGSTAGLVDLDEAYPRPWESTADRKWTGPGLAADGVLATRQSPSLEASWGSQGGGSPMSSPHLSFGLPRPPGSAAASRPRPQE